MMRGVFAALAVCALLATASVARADPAGAAAAAALFDDVVASPTALRVFLKAMPKGGDLHNQLGGAVYAEDWLSWAAADGYCVDAAGAAIVPPPCPAERSIKRLGEGNPPAFARLVDSLSTRGLQQGVGRDKLSGHDQFFSSFDRFGAIAGVSTARSMAATLRITAGDRASYIELIHNPPALAAYTHAAPDVPLDAAGLAAQYAREIAAIPAVLDRAAAELDRDEAAARAALGCGGAGAEPACDVTVRYLAWGWRDLPPAQAFRSLILAFAMADKDPRYAGINIVQPEDWVIALRDYDLHMAMIRFLAAKYPAVRRSIHAGELAFGAVPPAALRDHIAKAIDAGAQRIGHGTDIAQEDGALATMARMARAGIAVEINLTSNDVILGVKGGDHPLQLYRRLGVPVVLSTDDEGILRTDLTNEFLRAAREQGLRYADLKALARNSVKYAFVESAEKARLEAALEAQFDRFERLEVPAMAQAMKGNATKMQR